MPTTHACSSPSVVQFCQEPRTRPSPSHHFLTDLESLEDDALQEQATGDDAGEPLAEGVSA